MDTTPMKMKEKTLFLITLFGYGMKTVTRKDGEVIEYRDMHLPFGDIVAEVTDKGTKYFVADWGYTEVFPNALDIAVNRIKEAV